MAAEGRASRVYARLVIMLRWLVLAAVLVGVAAATVLLPPLSAAGQGPLHLVSPESPPAQAQVRVLEHFRLPLITRIAIVQHDPAGLPPAVLSGAAHQAAATDAQTRRNGIPASGVAAALPVPNSLDPLHPPTTLVTYVFGSPQDNIFGRVAAAHAYADRLGPDARVAGVTGTGPIQLEQGRITVDRLQLVEIASLVAVALIVGLAFRSVVAPVITLASAICAYLVADHVIGTVAVAFGTAAPSQLEAVVVALTLGASTDYSVFFLSSMRGRVLRGDDPREALRLAVTQNLPIVLVAGIVVAAGVATLRVAKLQLFQAFGPGLVITILASLVVAVTFVPAALAITGRWALWPGVRRHGTDDPESEPDELPRTRTRTRARLARALTHRWVAGPAVLVCLAALLAAASPLLTFRASVASARTLPAGDPVRTAAQVAGAGFAPGVLSPTVVLLERPGLAADPAALAAVQHEVQQVPGVAQVIGPAQQKLIDPNLMLGGFVSKDGSAARYLVVLDHEAMSADGIADLRRVEAAMPTALDRAGLSGTRVDYAGDSALAEFLVSTTRGDILRVGIAIVLVNMVLLMVFLRSLVAPVYLLACSVLSVGAALGLTTWFFQDVVGYPGLIFYAPFAAGVLLLSLGSDYNIFTVGRVWDVARTRPLREALVTALPRSTRPVNVAGLTLAASFAVVALIPVAPLRELAFAMAVGVLLDTFLVRSLLVPGLIVLVGKVSGWPGRRLAR